MSGCAGQVPWRHRISSRGILADALVLRVAAVCEQRSSGRGKGGFFSRRDTVASRRPLHGPVPIHLPGV